MKNIGFPDWSGPAGVMISRSKDKSRAVWSEYEKSDDDWLSLRVTVEIAGGLHLFERFENKEAEEAARIENNRRTAWRNAIAFAEQLWRAAPHREYIVLFRPENPIGREVICICQRLECAERSG